ncbi:MAG TPA: hypothetical protein VD948_02755 [Rhodothermales bacterium]|nr:hypothetical protein [Rhodothermales bacterium]
MTPENPLRSKRFLAYVLTLLVLLVAVVLKSPAVTDLGEAIVFGLPVFLGGESWVRGRQPRAAEAPPA